MSCISILILTTFWSSMSSLSCMDIILTTIWSRLNTTNSTSSVTYETGLNSLLAVVDSYQVSSSFTPVECYSSWMTLTLTPPTQVEVLKVELTEETAGRRVALTVANLPNLNSPPTCFYR